MKTAKIFLSQGDVMSFTDSDVRNIFNFEQSIIAILNNVPGAFSAVVMDDDGIVVLRYVDGQRFDRVHDSVSSY